MKKYVEQFVKYCIYASFFVPLVVVPSSYIFPFIVPKILLLRAIVTLMLGGFLLLLIINKQEYRPKFTAVNLVLISFLLSFTISTFVGTDPYHSFWDNHERMLGLFTILHYVAYYFICGSVLKNWKDWRLAMRIFTAAGSIVMFIGLLQVNDPNLLLNGGSSRVSSTLGNSIYVGGYGLFLLFASALLFFRDKNKWWKAAAVISGLLGLSGVFFSGSRGAMLGTIVGVLLAAVIYSITLKEKKVIRNVLWAAIAGVIIFVAIMYSARHSKFVTSIPALNRVLNTTVQEVMISPRVIAWQIAVESWKERPFFGWGPNNFFYAFNKYYNPRSLEFGYGETWFDNAHNIILNTLAVQGLVGLLVYLSIFGIAIGSLISAFRKSNLNMHIFVISVAFLVAHLTQNTTVFENPTSYLYFMFWLALINRFTRPAVDDGKAAQPDKEVGMPVIILVFLAVLVVVFIFEIQPARANKKTLSALAKIGNSPMVAMDIMKEALAFSSPHIDDIRSDLARTVTMTLGQYAEAYGKERGNEMLNIVYPALQENLSLHPMDIRNQMTLAQLAQVKAMINNDYKSLQESEKYLEDALTYSPRRQQILFGLSGIKLQLGKAQEAVNLLERALDEDPKIVESYWRLANTYMLIGMNEKAKEIFSLADKNGVDMDEQGIAIRKMLTATSTTKTGTKK